MDSTQLQGQISNIENQLSQYTSDLPSQIRSQIEAAYSPGLQRSLDTTKGLMGDYLGRYYDVTTMGPGTQGTSAMDLSPTQKLGLMGRELGTMAGSLQGTQRFSDYLGGQMTDMYGRAVDASRYGQQNLSDQYNRTFQQLQMARQLEEAEKDRQLQMQLSRNSGGGAGGFDIEALLKLLRDGQGGQPTQPSMPNPNDVIKKLQQTANAFAAQRGRGTGTYSLGGQQIGSSNDVHKYLTSMAQKYNVNVNPEWLWQQMGNNVGNYTPMPILR